MTSPNSPPSTRTASLKANFRLQLRKYVFRLFAGLSYDLRGPGAHLTTPSTLPNDLLQAHRHARGPPNTFPPHGYHPQKTKKLSRLCHRNGPQNEVSFVWRLADYYDLPYKSIYRKNNPDQNQLRVKTESKRGRWVYDRGGRRLETKNRNLI